MEECGTTKTISKEIIEKSEEGVKEQAQKRVEAWVDNNNQPAIIAPALESSNRSISLELPKITQLDPTQQPMARVARDSTDSTLKRGRPIYRSNRLISIGRLIGSAN